MDQVADGDIGAAQAMADGRDEREEEEDVLPCDNSACPSSVSMLSL